MPSEDLQARVTRILAQEVKPILQMDGGDIEVIDINDGVVRVRLHGACGGCPTTIMAVIMSVEQELRKRVPKVE